MSTIDFNSAIRNRADQVYGKFNYPTITIPEELQPQVRIPRLEFNDELPENDRSQCVFLPPIVAECLIKEIQVLKALLRKSKVDFRKPNRAINDALVLYRKLLSKRMPKEGMQIIKREAEKMWMYLEPQLDCMRFVIENDLNKVSRHIDDDTVAAYALNVKYLAHLSMEIDNICYHKIYKNADDKEWTPFVIASHVIPIVEKIAELATKSAGEQEVELKGVESWYEAMYRFCWNFEINTHLHVD